MRFAQYALLSVEGLIDKMTTIYPLNPRFMLPFVFVLALSLLFLLPGGSLHAQQSEEFFTYAENGTGPVATFTASDPEGATPIVWSLAAADAAIDVNGNGDTEDPEDIAAPATVDEGDFKIDQNGVLSFKNSPNFEAPTGGGVETVLKTYQVVVRASDGNKNDYFKVTVTVTDVEETGKVTWTVAPSGIAAPSTDIGLLQFRSGASLTAVVEDEDTFAPSPGTIIKWYRSSSRSATGTEIFTGISYPVVDADVGSYIRVVAAYRDANGHPDGSNRREEVSFVSDHPVQVAPGDLTLLNVAPDFGVDAASRRIAENSKGNLGAPITATDANSGDKLTYSRDGGTDQAFFSIDAATGQLMLVTAQVFNSATEGSGTDNEYEVTVQATDSSGEEAGDAVTVMVTVTNVDEKPFFTADLGTNIPSSPIMAVEHRENKVDSNNAGIDLEVGTYSAKDPEGAEVTLSLMGNDASLFELGDDTAEDNVNGVTQALSFKENPNYEMPGDRNRDNVYEVTVRASDGGLNADQKVIVKVTNEDEAPKVELSSKDAQVGVELTATLTDPEGGNPARFTNQMWTWRKGADATTAANAADIPGATSSTYTPISADATMVLRARVTYTGGDDPVLSDATNAVQSTSANLAPTFKDGTSTSLSVEEGSFDADTGRRDPNRCHGRQWRHADLHAGWH